MRGGEERGNANSATEQGWEDLEEKAYKEELLGRHADRPRKEREELLGEGDQEWNPEVSRKGQPTVLVDAAQHIEPGPMLRRRRKQWTRSESDKRSSRITS